MSARGGEGGSTFAGKVRDTIWAFKAWWSADMLATFRKVQRETGLPR